MAEVIKYGLIRDLPFLEWLEANIDRLMARDPDALAYAIERSCANKAEVVAGDERETAQGRRSRAAQSRPHLRPCHRNRPGLWRVAAWRRRRRRHGHGGRAVAATGLACRRRCRANSRRCCCAQACQSAGAALGADRYLDLMGHDKKVIAGRLRLVLLKRLGEAVTCGDAAEADIRAAIDACCA